MSAMPPNEDPSSQLVDAIAPSGTPVPEAFRTFDRLARATPPRPLFSEHSARFGAVLDPYRATHYFDLASHDPPLVRAVGERFLHIASTLGLPVPPALGPLLCELVPSCRGVEQVVLGIDARNPPAVTRLKYYVLFRSPSPDVVEALRVGLGVPGYPGLDPEQVFLVGIDLDASGLSDLKVYLRLDRARLGRTVRNLDEVRGLVDGSRGVVLQQCLRQPARRQLHFHATDDLFYAAWLAERAEVDAGVAALLVHVRDVESRLPRGRLGPWIVGLEYRDGTLGLASGNVYFHVT